MLIYQRLLINITIMHIWICRVYIHIWFKRIWEFSDWNENLIIFLAYWIVLWNFRWLPIRLDHIILLVVTLGLIIRYIFFEDRFPNNDFSSTTTTTTTSLIYPYHTIVSGGVLLASYATSSNNSNHSPAGSTTSADQITASESGKCLYVQWLLGKSQLREVFLMLAGFCTRWKALKIVNGFE
jgi:hypothetical protein